MQPRGEKKGGKEKGKNGVYARCRLSQTIKKYPPSMQAKREKR
jgi:hypothetical protein